MAGDDAPAGGQDARLAELVEGLTGADRGTSLHAVRETGLEPADALEVVARAMVRVDQPSPIRLSPALDHLGVPIDGDEALVEPAEG